MAAVESKSKTIRPLLPRSDAAPFGGTGRSTVQHNAIGSPMVAPRAPTRNRNSRKSPAEWERIKGPFMRLYQDYSLEDTMKALETEHGFIATRNQFNFMIKKWKLDKKAKASEMRHIIKIQRRRQQEDPTKETLFRIRHKLVGEDKIERFKREHTVLSALSSTPSAISWRSPTPTPQLPDESESTRLINRSPHCTPHAAIGPGSHLTNVDVGPTSCSPRTGGSPVVRTESRLSSFSPESSVMSQLDAFLQPTAGYCPDDPAHRQQISTDAIPSPSPTRLTPPLTPFKWWQAYGEWQQKLTSPKANQSPVYELLRDVIVDGSSYEDELFNQEKSKEFEIMKAEASFSSERRLTDNCALCRAFDFVFLWQVVEEQGRPLSYGLDWRWYVSEISKTIIHLSLAIDESSFNDTMFVLKIFIRACFNRGSSRDSLPILKAAMTISSHYKPQNLKQSHIFLDLVGYSILANRLEDGEKLLKKIMGEDFELYIPPDFIDEVDVPLPNDDRYFEGKVLWRRAASQLSAIRWFQSHRWSASRVFEDDRVGRYLTQCGGIAMNALHLCSKGVFVQHAVCKHNHFYHKDPCWMNVNNYRVSTVPGQFVWQIFWRFLYMYGNKLENLMQRCMKASFACHASTEPILYHLEGSSELWRDIRAADGNFENDLIQDEVQD